MPMQAKTWEDVDRAVDHAIAAGFLADYRDKLPSHPTKEFKQRIEPADVLGVCSHHSASMNQDPEATAEYDIGPNHISETGCPGLTYCAAISQIVEPTKVMLCRDMRDITWSQGIGGGIPDFSGDENRHLLATLVMGDFDEDGRRGKSVNPTSSQIQRWKWWTNWLSELFGFDGLGYFGHYDFGKRHCPGRTIRRLNECQRAGLVGLETDRDWQEALLRWNPDCLPKYGPDGDWGTESKRALVAFERAHKHKVDGIQDPFTELLLLRKYSGKS